MSQGLLGLSCSIKIKAIKIHGKNNYNANTVPSNAVEAT